MLVPWTAGTNISGARNDDSLLIHPTKECVHNTLNIKPENEVAGQKSGLQVSLDQMEIQHILDKTTLNVMPQGI